MKTLTISTSKGMTTKEIMHTTLDTKVWKSKYNNANM